MRAELGYDRHALPSIEHARARFCACTVRDSAVPAYTHPFDDMLALLSRSWPSIEFLTLEPGRLDDAQ